VTTPVTAPEVVVCAFSLFRKKVMRKIPTRSDTAIGRKLIEPPPRIRLDKAPRLVRET